MALTFFRLHEFFVSEYILYAAKLDSLSLNLSLKNPKKKEDVEKDIPAFFHIVSLASS